MVAAVAVLVVAPRDRSGDSAAGAPPGALPPGFYPPAPSTAVGMTPEWRAFADSVDRMCAVSFNYAMAQVDQTQRTARLQGWAGSRAESTVVALWADEDARILDGTAELGQPPERSALFARWRANVARRTALFRQASGVAAQGRFDQEGRILNRIDRLKRDSDRLGQRFGLRICTSN